MLKYIWLAEILGAGNRAAYELLRRYSCIEEIFELSEEEYRKNGLTKAQAKKLADKSLQRAEQIIRRCEKHEIAVHTIDDALYPTLLREIVNPPIVLYSRGDMTCLEGAITIGVVGTRSASSYGLMCSERISGSLAKAGFLIISGLADGIDCAANVGAVKSGMKTVAVLGNSLEVAYPARNAALMDKIIADSGVVISEYPPYTAPIGGNFPMRNRIISGLSYGLLVVEAPKKSGALITANLALEQNRDLFALPANINSVQGEGTNSLLKEGCAKIVTHPMDIIEEYIAIYPDKIKKEEEKKKVPMRIIPDKTEQKVAEETPTYDRVGRHGLSEYRVDTKEQKEELSLTDIERDIMGRIADSALGIDELVRGSGYTVGKVTAALTMLEMKGYAKAVAGGKFTSKFN